MATKNLPAMVGKTMTGGNQTGADVDGYKSILHPKPALCQVATISTPLYVPSDLETVTQWVCWRFAVVDGRQTKIPVNPRTGGNAKTDTPSTWADLETALDYYHTHTTYVSGVGLVVAGTDLVGVDLDHCIGDDLTIAPWALAIVRALDSYTEVSPSGTGLRIFAHGAKPGARCKRGGVELYDRTSTRFLTFTGKHLPGTPLELREVTAELAVVYADMFGPDPAPPVKRDPQPVDVDDLGLVALAIQAKNGARFAALWQGDASSHPSVSEADLALACHLAWWTGGDETRIDRLFRQSGLMREKWDVRHSGAGATYGRLTIAKALSLTTTYYEPPHKPVQSHETTAAGGVVVDAEQGITEADVWRHMHEHVHHDGEHCELCGKVRPWERVASGVVNGMLRSFRCHRTTCMDWQYHKAKEHIVEAAIHLWPACYATILPVAEYKRLKRRGVLHDRDDWRSALQIDGESRFVGSAFQVNQTSIALDWQTLGPMLAERWLTRKPGSRMGAAKVNARAKREAVACDRAVPAAVTVKVEVPEPEPVTTIDYAFSLPLLNMSTGYDLLDVLQAAGATVDHKLRRWSYPLSMRPTVHELVTLWADGSNLPRRCGEITACSETLTHASIQPSAVVVDVLAGDLHPDAAEISRTMTARTVKNHGRLSG